MPPHLDADGREAQPRARAIVRARAPTNAAKRASFSDGPDKSLPTPPASRFGLSQPGGARPLFPFSAVQGWARQQRAARLEPCIRRGKVKAERMLISAHGLVQQKC